MDHIEKKELENKFKFVEQLKKVGKLVTQAMLKNVDLNEESFEVTNEGTIQRKMSE